MAVFTPVDADQLSALAARFGLPVELRAKGITEGIENTNYLLYPNSAETPGWVLTLLEKPTELNYVLAVLESAHHAGLAVPRPLATTGGARFEVLEGRTALITPYIAGHHALRPDSRQCAAIGRFLGELHGGVRPAVRPRQDPQGLNWLLATAPKVLADDPVAREGLEQLAAAREALGKLPTHTCHGDLFRDNALFQGERLVGVIDWYNAAQAPAGYDLAIALNDWCLDPQGHLAEENAASLLAAYQDVLRLDEPVRNQMPLLRAWAALRFWTSRTLSAQRAGSDGHRLYQHKPPEAQRQILLAALDPREQTRWQQVMEVSGVG